MTGMLHLDGPDESTAHSTGAATAEFGCGTRGGHSLRQLPAEISGDTAGWCPRASARTPVESLVTQTPICVNHINKDILVLQRHS